MSTLIGEEIKRWTARHKSALVLEIIQGMTTISEANRAYDLPPSELESSVEDGKKGMENALRANRQAYAHRALRAPAQGAAGSLR